jgi:hypothetical protein
VPRRTCAGERGAWRATCGSVRSPHGLETCGNVARRPASWSLRSASSSECP